MQVVGALFARCCSVPCMKRHDREEEVGALLRVVCVESGAILGDRIARADTFRLRLLGLLPRRGLAWGEGLLLEPCNAIHTFFMRFPIDVLFLDRDGRVVAAVPALPPWRARRAGNAVRVLELPAGTLGRTGVGAGATLRFEIR